MTPRDPLERALGEALAGDATPSAGDADMLARLIDGALDAPPAPPPSGGVKLALGGGAAAVVGAALLAARLLGAPAAPAAPVERAPVVIAAPKADTTAATAPAIEAPTMSVDALPVARASDPRPVASAGARSSASAGARSSASDSVAAPPPSAAELFARANGARRAGRDDAAIADYRALERDHAGTPEAEAAHVALGRLLLDKRAQYTEALAEFDRYLAGSGSGALREEALIGRALALEHLGRSAEEERAWRAVLRDHPDSVYAGEARARLEALRR